MKVMKKETEVICVNYVQTTTTIEVLSERLSLSVIEQ